MPLVAGVDGRRGGWVVAVVDTEPVSRLLRLDFTMALADVLMDQQLRAIAIDMPIGLAPDGTRECDAAARRALKPFASRVFPAPVRPALDHPDDYAAACAASVRASGKALSRQTWNLIRSINEVDELAEDPRIVECHPELAFALLHGHPIAEPKKTVDGRATRLSALRTWLPDLVDPAYGDDGVDALACAWTAARIVAGKAITLPPGDVPLDQRGRPMRIVA